MKFFISIICIFLLIPDVSFSAASISPMLFFFRNARTSDFAQKALSVPNSASVTVRFSASPHLDTIEKLENHGLRFKRSGGDILHTGCLYLAMVDLDSLENLAVREDIIRIETTYNPSRTSSLDVSNPLVQASRVWNLSHDSFPIDGSGITVASVDTGIDVFHPAFFRYDGGSYAWIDVNNSGSFESGLDAVDLNGNGTAETGETLRFFNALFSDQYGIMTNDSAVYEADIDWLYNDVNNNGERDFGPDKGYYETSPSYGELFLVTEDSNSNNRLDVGEHLTGLGTSKVVAAYDSDGKHYRGSDLILSRGDQVNHGTSAFGILGGQFPGRRFVGMAPGLEFISINRLEVEDIFEAVLWAIEDGATMIMYEFGSWVLEFLDGSSDLEIFVDNLVDEGYHVFAASGNLAGPARNKHAAFTLEPNTSETLSFNLPSSYNITEVYISILWRNKLSWGPSCTLQLSETESLYLFNDMIPRTIGQYTVLSGGDSSPNEETARFDIIITSRTGMSGDMSIVLSSILRPLTLDMDAYISDNRTGWMHGAQFTNFLTDDGTVCAPGTAEKIITVGSFDPRGYRNPEGDFSDFSSWGDTTDGRRAVDITAPGFTVFSPASHYPGGVQPGGYVDFGGTSASLPHVVGCAALIAQASPSISPADLANVLFEFALADEFTGPVPNNKWGYGKLQCYDSITRSQIVSSLEAETMPAPFSVSFPYPNPFNTTTQFELHMSSNHSLPVDLIIFNTLGQKIRTIRNCNNSRPYATVTWDGKNDDRMPVSSGMYFFTFASAASSVVQSALFLK